MEEQELKLVSSIICLLNCCLLANAQSLGGAGAVDGTVLDPTGAVVAGAGVEIKSAITGYKKSTTTDESGAFHFANIPPNSYHLTVTAGGFTPAGRDVAIRSAVPIALKIPLAVAGAETTVNVEASGAAMLENVPYAHNDMDRAETSKLPTLSPGSGLSDAITMGSPGVVADSNGFFHPLGDHAQTSFSIDGQPISDQQSKAFSTQVPVNAIQSMELITGAPTAEYGDKTSLVVNAVTRSGLGQKPFGSLTTDYGSFGTLGEQATLGFGSSKLGNFLSVNTERSGRFLDTPEFYPMHDVGVNGTIFDRVDYQPNGTNVYHLNLFTARNWFQIPNTYDQANQDQHQKVMTWNLAPGYQHTFSPRALMTLSPFIRQDRVHYYASRNPFNDTPATLGQTRRLTNYGIKADISYSTGKHNLKAGTQIMQTRLREDFSLGVTDPAFNPVCVNQSGDPEALPSVTNPANCAALGFQANPNLQPGLVPFDLTRGGRLFDFHGTAAINQQAFFVQDSMTLGSLSINAGIRFDRYDGLSYGTGLQPRLGVSYQYKPTGTVLRAAYSRTFETPYNENLIVSSATGSGGLATNVFGAFASQPLKPGRRNQYNAGLEQAVKKYLLIGADYFWKYTDNAFDFDTLFNTPITVPISWRKSKIDGVSGRIGTPDMHGFQAFMTFGHTRARFFGPEQGGLIFNSPIAGSVFRIDHDQAFQQTTNLRYQRPKNGPWIEFTWRYDSGEVAGSVPDAAAALALTADQQTAIGLSCGGQAATLTSPILACNPAQLQSSRLRIPAPGTENDDHNPPRVAPRQLLDMSIGDDNVYHIENVRVTARFTVINLTNRDALYNFLSTFSGTHFLTPRSYQVQLGFAF